jgi:predicted GIY-YIG superfamily endonuclease
MTLNAESFRNPDEAIRWKKQIKGWSRKKKAALICGDWDRIRELSRSGNIASAGSAPFDRGSE